MFHDILKSVHEIKEIVLAVSKDIITQTSNIWHLKSYNTQQLFLNFHESFEKCSMCV